jgi:hypothetical protein
MRWNGEGGVEDGPPRLKSHLTPAVIAPDPEKEAKSRQVGVVIRTPVLGPPRGRQLRKTAHKDSCSRGGGGGEVGRVEEAEAQEGAMTCPRSHNLLLSEIVEHLLCARQCSRRGRM